MEALERLSTGLSLPPSLQTQSRRLSSGLPCGPGGLSIVLSTGLPRVVGWERPMGLWDPPPWEGSTSLASLDLSLLISKVG